MKELWNDIKNVFKKIKYKERVVCIHAFPPYEFGFFKKLLEANKHKGVTKEWLGLVCNKAILEAILRQEWYGDTPNVELRRKAVIELEKVLQDQHKLEILRNNTEGMLEPENYDEIENYATALVIHNLPDFASYLLFTGRYSMTNIQDEFDFNSNFLNKPNTNNYCKHKVVYTFTSYYNCFKFKVWYTNQSACAIADIFNTK